MNQYGALARQHWKRWRPASYAAITDPAAWFTDLGEQAAGEITALWAQMRAQAGNPPGEEYLARVARLNALRKQAEELVLTDLILLPPEPGTWPARAPCLRTVRTASLLIRLARRGRQTPAAASG